MRVQATSRYLHLSPRKARMILPGLRGKSVDDALTILRFTPRPGAKAVAKVVESAAANAENNFNLARQMLHIESIYAGDARILRRFRPVARGRAHPIARRTCHLTVVVSDQKE